MTASQRSRFREKQAKNKHTGLRFCGDGSHHVPKPSHPWRRPIMPWVKDDFAGGSPPLAIDGAGTVATPDTENRTKKEKK